MPRPLSVTIVVTLFFAAIIALVLIVVPVLQKELPLLQAQIPAFLAKANDMLAPKLQSLGIKVRRGQRRHQAAGLRPVGRHPATPSGPPC